MIYYTALLGRNYFISPEEFREIIIIFFSFFNKCTTFLVYFGFCWISYFLLAHGYYDLPLHFRDISLLNRDIRNTVSRSKSLLVSSENTICGQYLFILHMGRPICNPMKKQNEDPNCRIIWDLLMCFQCLGALDIDFFYWFIFIIFKQ